MQNMAFALWNMPKAPPIETIIGGLQGTKVPMILGQHYFVTNPVTGTGISPKWDFTSSGKFSGNQDAYFIGAPVGNVPAPSNPAKNVAWLHIGHVEGELADEVFRYDTVGGQPPTSVRICWKG